MIVVVVDCVVEVVVMAEVVMMVEVVVMVEVVHMYFTSPYHYVTRTRIQPPCAVFL